MSNTWPFSQQGKNGELRSLQTGEKNRSSLNDIQSLVKKCQILALYFFPKCLIHVGIECLTGRGGTEFTLTTA
jgi:hypothetical protein